RSARHAIFCSSACQDGRDHDSFPTRRSPDLPATYELARKISAGPPIAIRLAKRALYHSQDVDLRAALEFETFAQNIASATEDAREGIRAFVEKRPAAFKGR